MSSAPGFKRGLKDLFYLFLFLVIFAGIAIVWYEMQTQAFKFDRTNWLVFFGGFSTLIGWIIAAIVSLRNSTKQHTINTLLQSRLSVAFNERVKDFVAHFPQGSKVQPADLVDPAKAPGLEALKYLLNYHEFMAVGIAHGDLDHDLLKDSMQGIVVGLHERAEAYIEDKRKADPQNLEYFVWLYKRWKK